MKILYPDELNSRRLERSRRESRRARRQKLARLLRLGWTLIVVLVVTIGGLLMRPLPSVAAASKPLTFPAIQYASPMLWPAIGQASINIEGLGVVAASTGDIDQKPVPTASTAKLFTALMVMQKHPLKLGENGSNLTFTDSDVAIYQDYADKGGVVFPASAGQTISQLQALQALLLPSANNVADLLATWSYGSVSDYAAAATDYLRGQGLTNTTVHDASGFSPLTVSTASDLTRAMSLAMQDEVLASILKMSRVDIEPAGEILSTNKLLGTNGIVGGKTGNTDEARSCFVFAADHQLQDSSSVQIYGAVLGQQDMQTAMQTALQVLDVAKQNTVSDTIIKAGDKLSDIGLPWGSSATVVSRDDITINRWKPDTVSADLRLNDISFSTDTDQPVGSITLEGKDKPVDVYLQSEVTSPSVKWRILGRYQKS